MKKTIWKYLSLVVIGLLIIMACSMTDVQDALDDPSTPADPLPASFIGENVALVNNTWRLIEATHNSEVLNFEALAPLTFSFNRRGFFSFKTPKCYGVSYKVITKSKQRYRLASTVSPIPGCPELENAQEEALAKAFKSTTAYKIENNRLFLTGPNTQMILEIEAAILPPISPLATP